MTSNRTARGTDTSPSRAGHRVGHRAGLLLVAGLVVVVASGCSLGRAGSAATIDGRTVTTAELQSAARDHLAVMPGADPGEVQRGILRRMIVSAAIDEVARQAGVRVSAGQVAADRDEVLRSVGGRKGLVRALAQSEQPTFLAPGDVDRWIRDRLLFRAVAAQIAGAPLDPQAPGTQRALEQASSLLGATSKDLDVEMSPRYGRWDPSVGAVTPLVSGGLSRTADELAGRGS